jgi:hypothetical protein
MADRMLAVAGNSEVEVLPRLLAASESAIEGSLRMRTANEMRHLRFASD